MAEAVFVPHAACAEGPRIILSNGAGNTLALVMPNPEGAIFSAAALNMECKRTRGNDR